jgi:ABC-type uncharacterized transport system auxiliary subunit
MRVFWISIVLGVLAGCGSQRVPATTYYKLDIPPAPSPTAAPSSTAVSLRIEPLRTSSLVRQDRIVYRPAPDEVGFYEYHRWAEPPNDALTQALADQLTRRRVFQTVEISDNGGKADYVLTGSIDRLQEMDYGGSVKAQVTISAALEDSQGQTIWSGTASSESAVAKRDVQGVVMAMGQASQQAILKLSTDVTKVMQGTQLAPVSSAASSGR